MVYAKSAWYTQSLLYALTGAAMTGSPSTMTWPVGSGNDQYQYLSLHSSSGTDYTTGELQYGAATTTIAWVNTNEITGTGWATGGVQLSTAAAGSSVASTFSQFGSGPYGLEYNWANPLSVASTTLTGVYGCIMYWHGITAPVSKPMFLELCFGSAYNTVAGTFGITPSGSGLSQLTLTA
jgi:hypothetical protein